MARAQASRADATVQFRIPRAWLPRMDRAARQERRSRSNWLQRLVMDKLQPPVEAVEPTERSA